MLLFLFLLMYGTTSDTQPLNRMSNDSELHFTQVWVWEYQNEWIPENESGHKGEIAIYYHPEKDFWLFTQEAYGISGEMTDWIVGKPDGEYLIASTDEYGKKRIEKLSITIPETDSLNVLFFPKKEPMSFGNPDLGFPLIRGEKYVLNYLKTLDKTTLYLGDVAVDLSPVYYFNQLDIEAMLPVDFLTNIPANKIVLSDSTTTSGKNISLRFRYISHAEYYVHLGE